MDRNNLIETWQHNLSKKDNTYCNLSLNHFSTIDHFLVTHNVFDCITANKVINEVTNPSTHCFIYMSFNFNVNLRPIPIEKAIHNNSNYLWSAASSGDLVNYNNILNDKLSSIFISNDLLLCTNCNCSSNFHREEIDILCQSIIESCISASESCIPIARVRTKEITGWADQVKPEKDRSLFWHWLWLESGKPQPFAFALRLNFMPTRPRKRLFLTRP